MSDPYYRDRATKYAPKTPEEIASAARDLAACGYSDHTIAAILRMDVNALRQMLGQRSAA